MVFIGVVGVYRREKIGVCHHMGMGTEKEERPQVTVSYGDNNELGNWV